MRNIMLSLLAIAVSGCSSIPMNCEEACAFEHMMCKGAEITESLSFAQSVFGQADGVSEDNRSLKYQCEMDTGKADEIQKIRRRYMDKIHSNHVGIMGSKTSE